MTSMKQGIQFMRRQPGMESLIALAFLMTTLGFPVITYLVVFGEDVFHVEFRDDARWPLDPRLLRMHDDAFAGASTHRVGFDADGTLRLEDAQGARVLAGVPRASVGVCGKAWLVQLARKRARRVIVSIFVNPAQFAPHEDFASYPRSLKTDVGSLAGVDLVWAPTVETMYPHGFATQIVPQGPAKVGLEDAFRPHFFAGVATVVAKLLIQCAPDVAVFGEPQSSRTFCCAPVSR